jgi:CRP-like cAMP-binding protein
MRSPAFGDWGVMHDRYSGGNAVLDALPPGDASRTARVTSVVKLGIGDVLQIPGQRGAFVLFPIDAVLSVVATLQNGDTCEVGTIGSEGVSGADVAFGAPALRTTVCQVAGRAGRMAINDFLAVVAGSASFESALRATDAARVFFIEQQVICNTVHPIEERCARWLLNVADRVSRPTFALTHDFLAIMLGVRRASVSEAAADLQRSGAITYHRGIVTILDRALLESRSCECYGETKRVFADALIQPSPRSAAEPA